jgi:hypothetical protein
MLSACLGVATRSQSPFVRKEGSQNDAARDQ